MLKKLFALVLTLVFALTLAIPMQTFAAGIDKALENAIKTAKDKFSIPDDYKFTSTIGTDGAKKVFYLNWTNKDADAGGNISVNIDENGKVLYYYSYSQSDYSQMKKLPKISRQDAKLKADEWIENIGPGLLSQVKYVENIQGSVTEPYYYFNYYRVVDGIPFYNDQVSVNINRETGALQSYNCQWTDGLVFPTASDPITLEQAQDYYKTNLGLRMIYKYSYTDSDNKLKVYAVYTPVYDNGIYALDAFTGGRMQINGNYYGGFSDMAFAADQKAKVLEAAGGNIQLSPEEEKAVQDAAKLMPETDAEKIARAAKYLGLTDDFKMTSYYLNQNYPVRTDYVWSLSFTKEAEDEADTTDYINVGIDADSGNILNFYRSSPYKQDAIPVYDLTASKAAADKFLMENFPEYMEQMQYNELNTDNYIRSYGPEEQQNYSFKYDRLVNGAAFPDNGVNIDYDAVNGVITSFNLNWFDTAFPAVDKVISAADAYTKLFDNIGLDLEYKIKNPETDGKIIPPQPQTKPDVKLVYVLKPDKPLFLDANTGELLNSDGSPYKETKPVSYNDIEGSYAEKQIKVLAENGVYIEDTEFKPEADILQKDFFTLLSKTLSYYGPVITPDSTEKDIDDMYSFLISQNILKPGEKAPDSTVTREDAVKFIIRALKFDKVADIKGIYICPFNDRDSIGTDLLGYVTVASGLKIVSGYNGAFNPKTGLTRADAAIMIYNYLQV